MSARNESHPHSNWSELEHTTTALAPATPAATERPHSGPILVVEDSTITQRVVVRMIEQLGYTADVASHGCQALEMLERNPYQLVLMDCQMPVMDGFAATTAIRLREGDERHTPIIALTASDLPDERERCLQAGMDDHVAKPMNRDELRAVLGRWLPRSKPGTAAQPVEGRPPAIDMGALELLLGAPPAEAAELACELITLFVDDTPGLVAALRGALAEGDTAALRAHAHTLKGACGNLGLLALAAACREVETLANTGNHQALTAACARLATSYDVGVSALLELRRSLTA